QSGGDSLSHHRALLARNRVQRGLDVAADALPEGDIEVLLRPFGMLRRDAAVLEMPDAALLGEAPRRVVERLAGTLGLRGDAAVDAEGQRGEGMPEKQALDLGERQHAFDAPVRLRVEEAGAMP